MTESSSPETLEHMDAKTLEAMTVKQLRELAGAHFPQIKGISSLNKGPLVAAIQDAMGGAASAPAKKTVVAKPSPSASSAKQGAKGKQKADGAARKSAPLPVFTEADCSATTESGKAKAHVRFLRAAKQGAEDAVTRTALRKRMKRLKKATRRKAENA